MKDALSFFGAFSFVILLVVFGKFIGAGQVPEAVLTFSWLALGCYLAAFFATAQ